MGSVVMSGITARAMSVPVSSRTRAAIATASGVSADLSLRTMVPVTSPPSDGTDDTGIATPSVGPPVMTGTGSDDCQVLAPSTTVANTA